MSSEKKEDLKVMIQIQVRDMHGPATRKTFST